MGNVKTRIVNSTNMQAVLTLTDKNGRNSTFTLAANQATEREVPDGEITLSLMNANGVAIRPKKDLPSKIFIIQDSRQGMDREIITSEEMPEMCLHHQETIEHFFECKDWTKRFSLKSTVYNLLKDFDARDTEKRFSKAKYKTLLQDSLQRELPDRIVGRMADQLVLEFNNLNNVFMAAAIIGPEALVRIISGILISNISVITTSAGSVLAGVIVADAIIASGTTTVIGSTAGGLLAATGIGLAIAGVVGGSIWLGMSLGWSRSKLIMELTENIVKNFPQEAKEQLIRGYQEAQNPERILAAINRQ